MSQYLELGISTRCGIHPRAESPYMVPHLYTGSHLPTRIINNELPAETNLDLWFIRFETPPSPTNESSSRAKSH